MWITTRMQTSDAPPAPGAVTVERTGATLAVNAGEADLTIEVDRDRTAYLFGAVFYERRGDLAVPLVGADAPERLAAILADGVDRCVESVEGQYVGALLDRRDGAVTLFSDRYARLDLFWAETPGGGLIAATELDSVFERVEPVRDPVSFAHLLSVYGWYVPKGWTLYSNVHRLKVGGIVEVSMSSQSEREIPFRPAPVCAYDDSDLERYFDALADSVRLRAATGTTWVSASSGWDSTMLTAMLDHVVGIESVGMITGVLKYSDQTDVINRFETDKVERIADFFGTKPEFVEFDFRNPAAAAYWADILPYYRSRHVYAWSAFNFSRLADSLLASQGAGQIVFNGETSDSFHNFGFAQFGTMFHTDKRFTEYADKMACYLWGPSFLRKVLDGGYEQDKVWQIVTGSRAGHRFESEWASREEMVGSYLMPLFYGGVRVPFADPFGPAFTSEGAAAVRGFALHEAAPYALETLSAETAYSLYIHMYQSLHSQGGTVSSMKYAMERDGLAWRSPFNDLRMIDVLSRAPESWGRGLDFNHTKHPLKWVARNKVRFPYDVLDEGPHSYLYDVIEGFSLGAETLYRSGVSAMMKESVASRAYRDVLDDRLVDVAYLDLLVDGLLAGEEVRGAELNVLFSLIVLCTTGWY